jgi:hypothetical protein
MKFFSQFRKKTGELVLFKYKNKRIRRKKTFNFKTVSRVGILFDATNTNHFDPVYEFYKELLKKNNRHVVLLGYVDGKQVPEKYLFKKNIHIFTRKEVSFFFKPKSPDAIKFINYEFDILFDFTMLDDIVIDFVDALSFARFKVGRYFEGKKHLDLMIFVPDGLTIEYFINQVIYYMERINRPELVYKPFKRTL